MIDYAFWFGETIWRGRILDVLPWLYTVYIYMLPVEKARGSPPLSKMSRYHLSSFQSSTSLHNFTVPSSEADAKISSLGCQHILLTSWSCAFSFFTTKWNVGWFSSDTVESWKNTRKAWNAKKLHRPEGNTIPCPCSRVFATSTLSEELKGERSFHVRNLQWRYNERPTRTEMMEEGQVRVQPLTFSWRPVRRSDHRATGGEQQLHMCTTSNLMTSETL